MNERELTYLVNAISDKSDETAFEQLFRHYFIRLVDYIYTIIRHRQSAEDIAE